MNDNSTPPVTETLRRRRQAIIILGWSSVVFFGAWIAVQLAIGVIKGHSLIHGDVQPLQKGTQGGHGWLPDMLIFVATLIGLAMVIAGWQWLASRLGSDPDRRLSDAEIDAQPLYDVEVPALNKAIIVSAIVCMVAMAVTCAALLPAILIKYGL